MCFSFSPFFIIWPAASVITSWRGRCVMPLSSLATPHASHALPPPFSLPGRPLFMFFWARRPWTPLSRAPVSADRPFRPSASAGTAVPPRAQHVFLPSIFSLIFPWPLPLTPTSGAPRPGHLPVLDRALQPVGSCTCQVACGFFFSVSAPRNCGRVPRRTSC